MRITFFRTGRPKQFNYIPRYYDEQKEKAEDRQKRIERELGIEQEGGSYRPTLRKGIMTEKMNARRKAQRYSSIRLLVIIAILVLLTLYLLSGNISFNILQK